MSEPAQSREQRPDSAAQFAYIYDAEAGVIHKSGCAHLSLTHTLKGYDSLKTALRKGIKPCPFCCREDHRRALRSRNISIIERSNYNFVYAPGSPVLHHRDCPRILPAQKILGSVRYGTAVATGRRPCKTCRPSPANEPPPAARKIAHRPPPVVPLSAEEERALLRFKQAQQKRAATDLSSMKSETERNDFLTLTQPQYSFFIARGYRSVHLAHCPKLSGLSDLTGFSHYRDAMRGDHTPCKICKPSPKHDVEVSIPLFSRKRPKEKIADLIAICEKNEYLYGIEPPYFDVETPVGKWRIHTAHKPVALLHKNLVFIQGADDGYHKQPRLFLSLTDALLYIKRHDDKLLLQGAKRCLVPPWAPNYACGDDVVPPRCGEV